MIEADSRAASSSEEAARTFQPGYRLLPLFRHPARDERRLAATAIPTPQMLWGGKQTAEEGDPPQH